MTTFRAAPMRKFPEISLWNTRRSVASSRLHVARIDARCCPSLIRSSGRIRFSMRLASGSSGVSAVGGGSSSDSVSERSPTVEWLSAMSHAGRPVASSQKARSRLYGTRRMSAVPVSTASAHAASSGSATRK